MAQSQAQRTETGEQGESTTRRPARRHYISENGWIRSRHVAVSGAISSARNQVNPPAPSVCE